jgi:Secretion system C-terminal sorting domain
MQKHLLLTGALLCAILLSASAQNPCKRDSSILKTGGIVSPVPYSPTAPNYNLAVACIGRPYQQSITINVPKEFTFSGIMLSISNVVVSTSGGIKNLPAGLNYVCDPPNCVFPSGTLGCINVSGTPAASNKPDTVSLGITTVVNTNLAPVPLDFPGNALAPDDRYFLILRTDAQCRASSNDLAEQISAVRNMPNPFTGETAIQIDALRGGAYQFEVFDVAGRSLHSRSIRLTEGFNQFTFAADQLAPGAYFYRLRSAQGQVIKMMIVK